MDNLQQLLDFLNDLGEAGLALFVSRGSVVSLQEPASISSLSPWTRPSQTDAVRGTLNPEVAQTEGCHTI